MTKKMMTKKTQKPRAMRWCKVQQRGAPSAAAEKNAGVTLNKLTEY